MRMTVVVAGMDILGLMFVGRSAFGEEVLLHGAASTADQLINPPAV
jgi:hypothetical protein